jgi:hypothetical protein
VNVAVTERAAFMVTVQVVPLAASQPLQLPKVELASGDAVSVTSVPWAIPDTLHVEPQLIPPPLTVPDPLPLFCTASAWVGAPTGLKVAMTERAAFMVTVQVVPLAASQPLQLPKVELASGDAVSVTSVPWAIPDTLHVEPQLTPGPLTVPEPLPLFWTVSV